MRIWLSRLVTGILVLALSYQLGHLAYMNIRDADPLLAGWQEYEAETFASLMESGEPVLVEVYASWCPTCLAQHRAFEALITEGRAPRIHAVRLDYDRDAEFRATLGNLHTGTLLLMRNGHIEALGTGLTDPESIHKFLQEAL